MGVLTETTLRLREEIVSSRLARAALREDLVRQTEERRAQVAELCAGFAGDRAGAQRAWAGRAPVGSSRPGHEPRSKGARKH